MTEQLCPVCGCTVANADFNKDDVIYCCEPCASGKSSRGDSGCCTISEESEQK